MELNQFISERGFEDRDVSLLLNTVEINIDADLCVVIFILKKVNRKEKKLPIIGVVRWGIGNLITTIY